MGRLRREKSKSGIYHIMIRGINRQTIFKDNDDRERFLDTLNRFKFISNYDLYGYCLMDNHIHLLIKENTESISTAIKRISSSYVYWYNEKYDRIGHLFQGRFKSEPVEDDGYLLGVLRYIHQNPVKANMVKTAQEYQWSSYRDYIEKPKIANTTFILHILSSRKEEAIKALINYTNEENNNKFLDHDEGSKLSDKEVKDKIKEFGIEDICHLELLEKVKRNEIIKELKLIDGITIRQISEITGISKSVISRI